MSPPIPKPGPLSANSQTLSIAIPQAQTPEPDQRQKLYRVETSTFFTSAGQQTLYTGDQAWAIITLTLETAGPVVVSTKENILPVLSGKGAQLVTGTPMKFQVPRGNRLIVAASGLDRITVQVEQEAWQEQILGAVTQGFAGVGNVILQAVQQGARMLIGSLGGGPPPPKPGATSSPSRGTVGGGPIMRRK